jgi:hypothetical protein
MKFAALFFVLFFSISAKAWECEAWVTVDSDSGSLILNANGPMTDVLGDQSNYSSTYIKDDVAIRLSVQQVSGRVTVSIHNKHKLVLFNEANIGQLSPQQEMVSYTTQAEGHGIGAFVRISCI